MAESEGEWVSRAYLSKQYNSWLRLLSNQARELPLEWIS